MMAVPNGFPALCALCIIFGVTLNGCLLGDRLRGEPECSKQTNQADCSNEGCLWYPSCFGERTGGNCRRGARRLSWANSCPGGLPGTACRPLDANSPGSCATTSATTAHCNASIGCQCIDCPPAPTCKKIGPSNSVNCTLSADMHSCLPWGDCQCENCPNNAVAGRLYTTKSGVAAAKIVESSPGSGASPTGCDWSAWPALASKSVQMTEKPSAWVVERFKDAALGEHASVASFSRTTLELMDHGAPARLLDRTLAAARDEIQHAQMAFTLVRKWSAKPFELTGFDGELGEYGGATLADFAHRTITEACIGETPAVLRAAMSLRVAEDAQVHEYFHAVLVDERRHAELAWATVQWSLLSAHDRDSALATAMWQKVDKALETGLASMRAKVGLYASTLANEQNGLQFGILTPGLEAVVMDIAVLLVERLRSELKVINFTTGQSLTAFEVSAARHFDFALKAVGASNLKFDAKDLV